MQGEPARRQRARLIMPDQHTRSRLPAQGICRHQRGRVRYGRCVQRAADGWHAEGYVRVGGRYPMKVRIWESEAAQARIASGMKRQP